MKKINKLLLSIAPIGALSLTACALVSCGNKESHTVTTQSKVGSVTMTYSAASPVEETTEITLKINNARQTNVDDAKLVVIINNKHVMYDVGSIIPGDQNQLVYTKKKLQEEFTKIGYTITKNDSFAFNLVRVGQYNVVDNQLFRIDYKGELELVTDNELDSELANRFLYADAYGDLHLNSIDQESKLTFPDYIANCTTSGTNEVYLLKGTYYKDTAEPASATYDNPAQIKIHGILDNSKKNKLSSFQTYNPTLTTGDEGLQALACAFTMDNLIMAGRHGDYNASYLLDGMVCPYLNCDHCLFTGSYTANKGTVCKFTYCTFDSTNVSKQSGHKTYNPMMLYGQSIAEFDHCDFISNGKAIKIYYGPLGNDKTYNFSIKNCTFKLVDPVEVIEYPIDIDASEHTTNNTIFNITFEGENTLETNWYNKLIAMNPNAQNTLFHTKDGVDEFGKAVHIIINNEHPVPFAWDY